MKTNALVAFLMFQAVAGPAIADWENGRDIFSTRCIACHSFECNRAGPKLSGIIGRNAGAVSDYDGYSAAMKSSDVVWTEETLDAYLANPTDFIPGNGMAGASGNLENEQDRRDVIAFLKNPDSAMDLCY
ncbi:MAG: c-type cytochrome [Rhodovibrionaceae bacterium]|nr:c-type cytochrome [Rhodovibrionaceae bacterium]